MLVLINWSELTLFTMFIFSCTVHKWTVVVMVKN